MENKILIIFFCVILLVFTASLLLPKSLAIEDMFNNTPTSTFVYIALFMLLIGFFSWVNSFYWRLKYEKCQDIKKQ